MGVKTPMCFPKISVICVKYRAGPVRSLRSCTPGLPPEKGKRCFFVEKPIEKGGRIPKHLKKLCEFLHTKEHLSIRGKRPVLGRHQRLQLVRDRAELLHRIQHPIFII